MNTVRGRVYHTVDGGKERMKCKRRRKHFSCKAYCETRKKGTHFLPLHLSDSRGTVPPLRYYWLINRFKFTALLPHSLFSCHRHANVKSKVLPFLSTFDEMTHILSRE